MTNFFDLPTEIRLDIYKNVFGTGRVVFSTSRSDTDSLLPRAATQPVSCCRSSQLLAVCKTILEEARPILYAGTTFQVVSHVFAGKLPANFSDGALMAPYVRHLVWQVDCDMLKWMYQEDLQIRDSDLTQLSSLEVRCRAESWRDSFLGEHCDRDRFIQGREQAISYARFLQERMANKPQLVEDRRLLGRGCVILRLQNPTPVLSADVSSQIVAEQLMAADTVTQELLL
ncbi:uncharacterized protein HMPREF1541_07165 [Cyphellophora europaea CBS 101466]|uniref:F-box domain-containing protein n=1 Tax=Cyphellophora europaea (strain CBS 101466) TaxID=1220924 RepID=W2RPC1_CYPE1|nr:uncharacterized protein HMPREF1541_07165 [Cyphellophora europaea CBS 101466]ETN37543.1 hypothetical protein HMPREF1541_07165 [Cyphellophora europaea CBS 101466]